MIFFLLLRLLFDSESTEVRDGTAGIGKTSLDEVENMSENRLTLLDELLDLVSCSFDAGITLTSGLGEKMDGEKRDRPRSG